MAVRRLPCAAALLLLSAACARAAGTGGAPTPSSVQPAPPRVGEIPWRPWSREAFARARAEGKIVLVDVGIEGCTACRWMDEDTYRDPAVVARVAAHFVPVRVDAEARPDIGERFSAWAWPATLFLTADGTLLRAYRGNKRPRNFVPILDEIAAAAAAGTLRPEVSPPPAPIPGETTFDALRDTVVEQLDAAFDDAHGGWGRRQKLPLAAPVEHALFRARVLGEPTWRGRALRTADGMARLLDPVWGGVFVAGIGSWDAFVPEKRLASNADALLVFSWAHQVTGDARYLEHARQVSRYLTGFMQDPRGTFYTSQEDVAPRLPPDMDARAYYRLPDRQRRKFGIPPIDHAAYTDRNARAIRAYVAYYEASREPAHLAAAEAAARRLLDERSTEAGWFLQFTPGPEVAGDDRMRPADAVEGPFLRAQAHMGLALLALYRATASERYKTAAVSLARGTRATLWDDAHGGFFSGPPDPAGVLPRRKPIEDGAVMARFLFELAAYTKDDRYRRDARTAIRALADRRAIRAEGRMVGHLAVAVELARSGMLEFTVVGAPGDPAARALHAAALGVFDPRKVVHYEAPGRYPDRGRPALYVCNDVACSPPVTDPARVAAAAARFAARP